jgi:putative flippase GtrA
MADYLFASPVSDVSATAWQHIAMFVSFGAIGAAIAWVLFSFLVVLSQDERDISER